MNRIFPIALICGSLLAQQQQTPPPPVTQSDTVFGSRVEVVAAPVWVYDKDGNYVDGLRPDQFHIFDNNKEQNITSVDVIFHPISMVICIQANANISGLIQPISRIGNLMKPLVLGEQGEAAVLAYDSRIRTLQNFTADGDKITEAVKKITAYSGSTSQHMVDAVAEATRMLQYRPKDRRRVILLIGERRDLGSEMRGREALIGLQMNNIIMYDINMAQFLTKMTAPPPDPRPDVIPPAASPMPSGVAATPNTIMQTYGTQGARAEFVPVLVEIYRDAKAILKSNVVDVFTKGTGGEEFTYSGVRSLEQAITKLSESLHSSYVVTYSPNNKGDGGFHQITVDVTGGGARYVRTRPGYWLGPKQ